MTSEETTFEDSQDPAYSVLFIFALPILARKTRGDSHPSADHPFTKSDFSSKAALLDRFAPVSCVTDSHACMHFHRVHGSGTDVSTPWHRQSSFQDAECCPLPLVVFSSVLVSTATITVAFHRRNGHWSDLTPTAMPYRRITKKGTQAARCDELSHKPKSESYTSDRSTQLKIALRVLSFSRVELWRC